MIARIKIAMLETDSILTDVGRAVTGYCPPMLYGRSRSSDVQKTTAVDLKLTRP